MIETRATSSGLVRNSNDSAWKFGRDCTSILWIFSLLAAYTQQTYHRGVDCLSSRKDTSQAQDAPAE